jgi:PAS domain S-box-containing protein
MSDTRISGPLKVLIVEHDDADAELCVHALREAGYDVSADIVATPRELAATVQANEYDIVLADYRLPGWTGMDALALLRSMGRHMPVLLVTGTLGDERAVECIKEGAADYVIKHNIARLPIAVARALAEQRLREEQLRNQELIKKLQLAVDQSPAAVLITDPSGTIEYVNERFSEVTGYTTEEVIGRTPRILKSGRTPSQVYRDMWATIRGGGVWQGEVLNRRKSGDVLWDAITISSIRGADGGITHFVGTQTDITERKHAAQTLRDRDELFRQLAGNVREVFFVVDSDFEEMLYINRAYSEIFGRSTQSLYENPRSFIEAVIPEDRPKLLESIARTQRGELAPEVEFRVRLPSGEQRWLLAQGAPIRNDLGEVYRISGVVLDITERRRAQEALAISEERFRRLTEASFDGIAIVDGTVVREANRGFAEMFGYTPDEVRGRPVVDFVAEESVEDVTRRIAERVDGTYELIGKRKDGKRIIVEATAKHHEVGGVWERVTALRDITEKRQLEHQFRQAQKMEAVGRLAGGIAHDFNNLLTVIMSYAELLLREAGPNEVTRGDLEQIRKAAEGAADLTRQLLAFSRQQVTQPRPVRVEEIVSEAQPLLQRLVGEDVELESVLQEPASVIVIDPVQLEQVLMNLAANARDAMPSGGRLTIETGVIDFDEEYVRTHALATLGRYVVISVSDTGVGMDADTQAHIFEPFFTTKAIGRGTGLGLATVYGIVKQAGGFIWVYSEPGAGSTFKIYLPLADAVPLPLQPTVALGSAPRGHETVLLVEDSAAVRKVTAEILQRCGYTVLVAPDSRVALELAARHGSPVHLLLTDVVMPGLSGRTLAEMLTAEFPGMRVLYMSGYADDAVVRHGVLNAGEAYLQKPFTPGALAVKVREVLDSPARRA